jgi:hypothetical protein
VTTPIATALEETLKIDYSTLCCLEKCRPNYGIHARGTGNASLLFDTLRNDKVLVVEMQTMEM